MPVLRFSVFELDPEAGELRREGRRIHLAAQPLKILALLASRPGEVVSREELRRHVWGDHTFVAFDPSLNFCIASIRAALNDDARSPRFVETRPRRGYRFLAEVRKVGVAGARSPLSDDPARAAGTRGARRLPRWAWAAALPVLLGQSPALPPAHTRATALPEALAAFDRGRKRGAQGAVGRRQSVYDLREATRLDPRFAEAYYALGDTYLRLASDRELPAEPALREANAAALRAVALEPIAETRQLSGVLRLLNDGDWAGAEHDLAEAVRLAPSWDGGLVAYARFLSAKGDDARALSLIDRAETLSPSCDLVLFDSGVIRYRARRPEEALRKLDAALTYGPPRHVTAADWEREVVSLRLRIRVSQGEWDEARLEAARLLAVNGVSEAVRERFGTGDPREALRRFFAKSAERMSAPAEAGQVPPTRLARVYAALGDADRALRWLGRAAAERDPDLVYGLRDPDYDEMRTDPRFAALEERLRGGTRRGRRFPEPGILAQLASP